MEKNIISILCIVLSTLSISAQTDSINFEHAQYLVDEERYFEAIKYIERFEQECNQNKIDSVRMQFNYIKGSALYFMDRYEEALPYLNKALLEIEKLPHEDCIYLEIIYGIGACYNKLKQYIDAEKYFRRVIIRGNVLKFKCAITSQTLSELAGVYNQLGYTKLAQECSAKINSIVNGLPEDSWSNKVDLLLYLADSYKEQKRFDDEIETYHKILQLIDSNIGKDNNEYLTYSSILFLRLQFINRSDDAIPVLKQIIDVGNYLNNNTLVCNAYENYLELYAKKNDVEIVEKTLPDAVKYIQNTKEYDWQNHNLYEIIGNAFMEAGNYSYGRQYLEKPWNKKFPQTIRALGNLGISYYDINPQKSLSLFKEAESLINDSTDLVTKKIIYSNINTLCSKLKRFDEAIKYAEKAAPYIKEVDGSDAYASHLVSWALDLINAKQTERALLLFKEVDESLPKLSDRTKTYYYSQYGFASIGNSNYTEAIKALKKGIEISIETNGDDNIFLTTMFHNLGRAYMLQQDYDNALLYLNKSKALQMKMNGKIMQRTLDYIKECESK